MPIAIYKKRGFANTPTAIKIEKANIVIINNDNKIMTIKLIIVIVDNVLFITFNSLNEVLVDFNYKDVSVAIPVLTSYGVENAFDALVRVPKSTDVIPSAIMFIAFPN